MQKNCKQDKVGGIHRLRGKAEAGNPLCSACCTEEVKNAELIFATQRQKFFLTTFPLPLDKRKKMWYSY